MDIFSAMKQRKSARAYLDKPVSRADIEEIFKYAGLAPSAINLQPWEFVVTYGEEKDRLVRRLQKVHAERDVSCGPGTSAPLPERFSKRGSKALKAMEPQVSKLNLPFNEFVEKGSCSFYGAPVAIIVTIDRVFPQIRYLDVGLSVSYLLLAAHAKGLGTCPIGLITAYADDIADVLSIPEEKEIVLAISLGYADEASPANDFKTDREPLSEIFTWYE
ncbi:nitroreductase [Desulfonema magnum]|uniref:Nitroreductase n=1 Tax=Desulfonema magnum TaxID=45655 RepID=A0A975GKL3_9BACT|nr:nitroreductase [Desulfonema magnum]QTA84630.1 Nitroreductase [Desulfonema magnum]